MELFSDYPWLPVVLLVLLPFALHVPLWLLGRSINPTWFYSGVTQGSRLLPEYPFLDPNVGFTSQALGHLAAWDWLHGIVPWWNPYSGIGMPLAGELQPSAFFLPFNLLLMLPEGVLWLQICMQIIAGLATYALLRELGISRLATLMGSALFMLNGTVAWAPGPAAVYYALPFLPLLIWGIERARKQESGAASILAIGAAIAWSILAGFPEPAYISGLLALAWGVYRLAGGPRRWMMARRAIAGWVLGLLVAAPLLIAFVDYVRQSDSFGVHTLGEQRLPWAAFSTTLMPYVYGPLGSTFHSDPLNYIWGNIGGYTGILIVLLAAAGLIGMTYKSEHRGLRFLLLAWILLAWAKTFGVQPVMALMNHLPLLKQASFFRYSPPSWELALAILAAFGLDDFWKGARARRWAFAIAAGLLIVGVVVAWPLRAFWERPRAQAPVMFALLGASLVWAVAGLFAAGLAWTRLHGERRRAVLAGLLVFDAAVMFIVPQLCGVRGGRIDTQAMQFLHDHAGIARIHALGQPIQPNYGAYFQVASIDHNVLPVPKLWADYIDRNLLPGFLAKSSGIVFTPGYFGVGVGERTLSQNLASYLDLGVRYIVTDPGKGPIPTTFLPMAGTDNQPVADKSQSFISRFRRMSVISAVLARSHSIVGDQTKPAIERSIAAGILKMDHSLAAAGSREDATADSNSIEAANPGRIVLQSGDSAKISVPAPPPALPGSPISAVGVMINNYGNTADGELAMQICAGTVCQSGQRSLSESADHTIFQLPLDKPLAAPAGAPLQLSFTHRNGSRPVELWMESVAPGLAQQLQGPNGEQQGQALQLAFEYGTGLPGLRKVYADSVMDIWELPDAAPYFQVMQGGPCRLVSMRREEVTAECSAPAVLRRRELYMPGWGVRVNGDKSVAVQQDGLFQLAALPAGRSQARYHFAPPYVNFGWVASLIGMTGLLWQVILLARTRRQPI